MVKLEIISAENKKAELEALKVLQEMKREQERAARAARVEILIENVFNLVKEKIESSRHSWVDAYIGEDDLREWHWPKEDELLEAITVVSEFLVMAGYRVNPYHTYSKSWQTRSGKHGYLYIFID